MHVCMEFDPIAQEQAGGMQFNSSGAFSDTSDFKPVACIVPARYAGEGHSILGMGKQCEVCDS